MTWRDAADVTQFAPAPGICRSAPRPSPENRGPEPEPGPTFHSGASFRDDGPLDPVRTPGARRSARAALSGQSLLHRESGHHSPRAAGSRLHRASPLAASSQAARLFRKDETGDPIKLGMAYAAFFLWPTWTKPESTTRDLACITQTAGRRNNRRLGYHRRLRRNGGGSPPGGGPLAQVIFEIWSDRSDDRLYGSIRYRQSGYPGSLFRTDGRGLTSRQIRPAPRVKLLGAASTRIMVAP